MENIIVVKNLTKEYNSFSAVEDITFSVKRGEIFGFLGPNGAGKSTTIKMLTTLLLPTRGSILIDKFNPVTEQDKVRQLFGIVFQDPSIDDELTAHENMEFHGMLYNLPREILGNRIKELLKMVELYDRKDQLVKRFSGGMKRRLEIARGLLHHPKILFLDEPTIGLDPQTRNHIWKYIKELNKKEHITIFFTTHYMDEAERAAHRIMIIDHGKIVSQGTSKQLKKKTGKKTLEDAFISLTGRSIREAEATSLDRMRLRKGTIRR